MDGLTTLETSQKTSRNTAPSGRTRNTTIHHVKTFGFDGGNRFIKAATDPHAPFVIPSIRAFLDPDQETDPEAESVTISYKAGPCTAILGQRYVVGLQAAELKGEETYYIEKAKIAPSLLLAIAGKFAVSEATRIETAAVALPDDRDRESNEAISKAVRGTHTLEVDGKLKSLQIQSINVRPENTDAFRWIAQNDGFPPGKINGVVDVGGGNVTAALFSARGKLLRESRIVATGALAIARQISQHASMLRLETKGNTARLDLILNAIADNTLTYGNTGHNFQEIYESCRQRWETSIRSKVKTTWQDWVADIGRIAIVGGGAEMLRPVEIATKGVFFVADDAQTATVRGMVLS